MDVSPGSETAPTFSVTVRSAPPNMTGVTLGTLVNPGSLAAGINTFAAAGAGIGLAANTTYFVVVDWTGGGALSVMRTTSDAEDDGAATGWSLEDSSFNHDGSVWQLDTQSRAFMIAVFGFDVTTPPDRPTGLSVATQEGSLDVSVDWDDVERATSYLVRLRKGGPGHQLNEGVRVETSGATIRLPDYGDWVVRVEACNAVGCGLGAAERFQVQPGS